MTLSPGTLFFHRLETFEVFEQTKLEIAEDPEFAIKAAEMINLPYIRSFFYALSMPCFGLLFTLVSFFRQDPSPDLLLFVIAVAPTCFALWKIMVKKRPLFLIIGAVYAILVIPVSRVLIHMNFFDIDWSSPTLKRLVLALVFAQFVTLSTAMTTCGLDYYRYTNPRVVLLDYKACYETLRNIYSKRANFLVWLWHHCDLIMLSLWGLSWKFDRNMSIPLLIGGSVLSIILTVPATKYILQLRMIDLMLPCVTHRKARKQDIRSYVKPIGAIAFGTVASSSSQAMLLIAWLYCTLFPSPYSVTYIRMAKLLLLCGMFLNATAKVLSLFLLIHPVESSKFGNKL